ncbi:hypothetical protein PPL_11574 [Heterostelium album PN500]|uniref:Protein kinase domain-containing protein n=1 Tax=Heterostelium pallidum (strain ATCC 26659 / Pp 5 / PN500) TaxID=670386 RepID=D3BVI3_HETP5|nr:hypothetical protein PPL_11574 [Heterostelium album PN500]EFA74606.1 hypothetical protein PPL_11574 [Heterostelium album PN500]|eukprot:XP_020426740.1 hypothetical protein PPL_11574 [Heterostelium album PN500]
MNQNYIEKTDKLVNGRNILKFRIDVYLGRLIILMHNHLKDINDNGSEQHRNIILLGNIDTINNVIVMPDGVDNEYQLIIIKLESTLKNDKSNSHCSGDQLSMHIELLKSSQSYTINIAECQFNNNLDYFKLSHSINNNRYQSISRFPNSNKINNINYENDQKNYERSLNEIRAMQLLIDNPRFVQLVDHFDDKDNKIFHIITKYCDGGDLAVKHKRMIDQNRIFKESEIIKYITQLFNILLELDKHGIVHCDIKPSNIFIEVCTYDITLMLGDFGCLKFLDDPSTIIEYQDTNEDIPQGSELAIESIGEDISEPTICPIAKINSNTLINATRGTPGYIAPEAMNRQYAQSCDFFSVGSTILKLLCCHQDDRDNHQLFQTKGEIKISENRYSKQLIHFIHRLLDKSPKNRESMNQFLNQYIETVIEDDTIIFNVNAPFENSSEYVTDLYFGNEFNQLLKPDSLPPNLTTLTFGINFNQPIPADVLPKSLKRLSFGQFFNQKLEKGMLPDSLITLNLFGEVFNQIWSEGAFPLSLSTLVLGDLPEHLVWLNLGSFNQRLEIGVLPKTLERLTFKEYNQELDIGVLPQSLHFLKFYSFNQKIQEKVLPNSVKVLEFTENFNHPLEIGVLPSSLESLFLPKDYEHTFKIRVLPSSLKRMTIFNNPQSTGHFNYQVLISEEDIGNNRIPLPKPMETLIIGGYYQKDEMKQGNLLSNLKTLEIDLGNRQKLSAMILTNSHDSLQFIKEYYPDYYSAHNLSEMMDSPTDSENSQIKGNHIIALLLTQYNIFKYEKQK